MRQPILRFLLLFAIVIIFVGCTTNHQPRSSSEDTNIALERPTSPSLVTTIAFGSCNKDDHAQPLWQPIIQNQPDLWIWLGDIIYADTSNMRLMQQKYAAQKDNPNYQELLQTTKVLGTWDDHDYGKNNGGKDYPFKAQSQQLFLDFLDEPPESPRRQQAGVYATYTYGPPGQQVKVILLDVRYHRDQPGANSDILGAVQWAWLEKVLKNSTADIQIIASGSQIIPAEHRYEKWADYPKSRQRLFDLIKNSGASGVILLSGDRHFAEISTLQDPSLPYPVYEVTASGMTHSWENFTGEPNRYRQGSFFKQLNFGLIQIDWQTEPVQISLEIRDRTNQVQLRQQINLAELRSPIPTP